MTLECRLKSIPYLRTNFLKSKTESYKLLCWIQIRRVFNLIQVYIMYHNSLLMRFFNIQGFVIKWSHSSISKYFPDLRLVFKIFDHSDQVPRLLTALALRRIYALLDCAASSERQVPFIIPPLQPPPLCYLFLPHLFMSFYLYLRSVTCKSEHRQYIAWWNISASCHVPNQTVFKLIFFPSYFFTSIFVSISKPHDADKVSIRDAH